MPRDEASRRPFLYVFLPSRTEGCIFFRGGRILTDRRRGMTWATGLAARGCFCCSLHWWDAQTASAQMKNRRCGQCRQPDRFRTGLVPESHPGLYSLSPVKEWSRGFPAGILSPAHHSGIGRGHDPGHVWRNDGGRHPGLCTPGNYFDAGQYTITSKGGPDVGAFTAQADVPAASFVWTNIVDVTNRSTARRT